MNSISLLNLSFWGKLLTAFDLIPKVVYFLYACLSSAVDALQALVRKLAGLDVYYQTVNGEAQAVSGVDPLTEFIYGILGFGDSAYMYEALNTVFWSLAIFGLIVLSVSVIVAMIKSHYSEDTSATSPWKYIYTAGKAIFTFALVPLAVIIGLQLSSFVLRTLDNITAGSATNAELQTMFGSDAMSRFQPGEEAEVGDDGQVEFQTLTYGNYDLFGNGLPTSTVTFSGMLFNASAYSSNRARLGQYDVNHMRGFFGGLFGADGSDYSQATTNAERLEYMAGQVDYLFMNNIHFRESYSYSSVVSEADDIAPVWSATDFFAPGSVESFSKFNVSLVWIFYNLWQFNYIIAFVGVFTTFVIMISIVFGMMTRLIKGAALFLVYPALLGIAPLDNFNAFKGWVKNFMSQVMMAFGSIIGINLLMLILPYVQNISFFNIGIVDALIQLIMLITGLLMAKDFIGIVNGFVGGADALNAGDAMKGTVGGKLKAGIKPVANVAGAGVRLAGKGAMMGVRATSNLVKAGAYTIANKTSASRANRAKKKAEKLSSMAEAKKTENKKTLQTLRLSNNNKTGYKAEVDKARKDAIAKAAKQGLSKTAQAEAGRKASLAAADRIAKKNNLNNYKTNEKKIDKYTRKADKAQLKQQNLEKKYKLHTTTGGSYMRSKDTKKQVRDHFLKVPAQMGKDMLDMGKTLADGFLKTLKSAGGFLMPDKLQSAAKEIMGESLSYKGGVFEESEKRKKEAAGKAAATEKEARSADTQKTIAESTSKQAELTRDMVASLKSIATSTSNNASLQKATQQAINNLAKQLGNNNNGGSSGSSNP